MAFLRFIVAILILIMGTVACFSIAKFIISFFGLLFDDLTGTDTYFMWTLS